MDSEAFKDLRFFPSVDVEIPLASLIEKLNPSKHSDQIQTIAHDTLSRMQGKWKPRALIRYFDLDLDQSMGKARIKHPSGRDIPLDFGFSGRFLEPATQVMVTIHTIGGALDRQSAKASRRGDLLEAYMIDLIGLTALEKTTDIVKGMAENDAKQMGWGVGPFLSPGSVHGWDLAEQSRLCRLLPIETINVAMGDSGMLSPVKTVAGIIGLGPAYGTVKVGRTCEVCSKRGSCQMNRQHLLGAMSNAP